MTSSEGIDPSHSGPREQRADSAVAASLLARGLRGAGRLLAFWLAARFFPLDDAGRFALWSTAGSFAGVLFDLGLSEHLMRLLPAAGVERAAYIASAMRLRAASAFASIGAATIAAAALGDIGGLGAFLFGLAIAFLDFLAAIRRGLGQFRLESLDSGLVSGAGLGAGTLAIGVGASFAEFELVLGAASVAMILQRSSALLRAAGGFRSRTPMWRDLLARSRWLWAKALLGWAYLDSTILLLGLLTSTGEVAVFAAAARLVGFITQPFIALMWVFTPALAHEDAAGGSRFESGLHRLNLIGVAAIPAAAAGCVLLGRLALGGLGGDYRSAERILILLALGFAANAGLLSSVPLVVRGLERWQVLISLAGYGVVLVTTVLLSPSRGALGAAAAVLIGLLVSKLLLVIAYLRAKLRIGGPSLFLALAADAAWLAVLLATSGTAFDLWLLAGGLASIIATFLQLSRTPLFARRI